MIHSELEIGDVLMDEGSPYRTVLIVANHVYFNLESGETVEIGDLLTRIVDPSLLLIREKTSK